MMLCQDADILYWDGLVFSNTAVGQIVVSGSGTLTGTVIAAGSDLSGFDLEVGQVAQITGAVAGQFPITAVTSTTLAVSLLSAGLQPDDGSAGAPVSPYISSGSVAFVVSTFWQYRRVISDQLLAAAGVLASPVTGNTPTLLNPQDFKRACVLGSLALIYNSLATSNITDPQHYIDRNVIYATLYSQAMRSLRAQLDWNGDGEVDEVRYLGEIALRRQ